MDMIPNKLSDRAHTASKQLCMNVRSMCISCDKEGKFTPPLFGTASAFLSRNSKFSLGTTLTSSHNIIIRLREDSKCLLLSILLVLIVGISSMPPSPKDNRLCFDSMVTR